MKRKTMKPTTLKKANKEKRLWLKRSWDKYLSLSRQFAKMNIRKEEQEERQWLNKLLVDAFTEESLKRLNFSLEQLQRIMEVITERETEQEGEMDEEEKEPYEKEKA